MTLYVDEDEGSSDIVTMRESTANISTKYHNQPALISDEEKCRIITTAAKLIKADN